MSTNLVKRSQGRSLLTRPKNGPLPCQKREHLRWKLSPIRANWRMAKVSVLTFVRMKKSVTSPISYARMESITPTGKKSPMRTSLCFCATWTRRASCGLMPKPLRNISRQSRLNMLTFWATQQAWNQRTKVLNPINDCTSHHLKGFAYCHFKAPGIPCPSKMNPIFQTKLADSCWITFQPLSAPKQAMWKTTLNNG